MVSTLSLLCVDRSLGSKASGSGLHLCSREAVPGPHSSLRNICSIIAQEQMFLVYIAGPKCTLLSSSKRIIKSVKKALEPGEMAQQ